MTPTDDLDIEYQWKHRNEMIQVEGMYLDEQQVQYLIEVLRSLREDGFYLRDRFITLATIVRRCLDDFEKRRDGWDVCSVSTAEALLRSNKMIGDYV